MVNNTQSAESFENTAFEYDGQIKNGKLVNYVRV